MVDSVFPAPLSPLERDSSHMIIMHSHVTFTLDLQLLNQVSYILLPILQWNPSNTDTNGAEGSVIVSEVSSFQRLECKQEWYILGVGKGVLFREVSSVHECPELHIHMCVLL